MKKYTKTGQEVELIQKLDGGMFLVAARRIFETQYSDYDDGYSDYHSERELFTVEVLFDEPPVLKFHEAIERLTLEVQALKDEERSMQSRMKDLEKEHRARMDKLQQYDKLEYLEEFLDGAITHYVTVETYSDSRIFALKDTNSEYDRKHFRLLGLFGKTEGDVTWRLNEYRDGSGGWTTVIPCKSYEEALEEMQRYLDEQTNNKTNSSLIELAEEYNLQLPEGYKQKVADRKKKNKQREVKKLEVQLAKARDEVKCLK